MESAGCTGRSTTSLEDQLAPARERRSAAPAGTQGESLVHMARIDAAMASINVRDGALAARFAESPDTGANKKAIVPVGTNF
jgi:hypothetical protein